MVKIKTNQGKRSKVTKKKNLNSYNYNYSRHNPYKIEPIKKRPNKKKKKGKKKKKTQRINKKKLFGLILILLLIILFIVWLCMRNELDINLQILNCNDNKVILKTSDVKLWNDSINKLKDKSIECYIEKDNFNIKLNNNKLYSNKQYNYKIEEKIINCNYNNLKDIEAEQFIIKHPEVIDTIEFIEVNKNEKWNSVHKLDIYHEQDSKTDVNRIETIDLDSQNNDKIKLVNYLLNKKILFVYIPLTEIKLEENIEINEEGKYELKFEFTPENATDKSMQYEYDHDIIEINEQNVVTALKPGETQIKLKGENGKIEKTINVKINQVVKETKTDKKNDSKETTVGLTYIKGILLVNKKYELPSTYDPGVSDTAVSAFNTMKEAAAKDGISLYIKSGYRSYETQKYLFSSNVSKYGEEKANTFSARAGQSEHQTGLAFDVNSTLYAFANTKEGIWIANNCYDYGFIIRFLKGKEDITGYVYEPWHIRYVGEEHSLKMKESGQCLEEYLGVN